MTEYGRIHTDGSRSGGQPIVIREGRVMNGGICSQESLPNRPAPPAPNKAVAKIDALRQPTQSDALLEGDAQTILYLLGVRHGREDERAKIAAENSQPTQSDCEVAASIRSALYRACSNMPNYPKGIVEPFVAAHHRHGYDQGYYDGSTRQPTQSDALREENERLRHDLERQMTIANEYVNEVERLREALEALERIAVIKADDGEDFSEWHDDVIIRCEITVADLKAVRAALDALGFEIREKSK